MLGVQEIIDALVDGAKLENEAALARLLGDGHANNYLSLWKKHKRVNLQEVIAFCEVRQIDIRKVLQGPLSNDTDGLDELQLFVINKIRAKPAAQEPDRDPVRDVAARRRRSESNRSADGGKCLESWHSRQSNPLLLHRE